MALQKSKILATGVTGDYWKLISISLDRKTLCLSGRLALFLSQAASTAQKEHLGFVKNFSFTIQKEQQFDNLIALMYDLIKDRANEEVVHNLFSVPADPDLSNSIDV